jgi:hypothetical protein
MKPLLISGSVTARTFALVAVPLLFVIERCAFAGDASAVTGIVSHVSVVSDQIEDVSSLEAWKKAFISDTMTDQQKAIAIWKSVCEFRHQAIPPAEGLTIGPASASHVHDPIKAFNVYGYGQCCCASAHIETLARYLGLETRGWGINNHSVPEIKIDGRWSMFDASLMNYFLTPDRQTIAGLGEIHSSIVEWLQQHPEYKNKKGRDLEGLMKNGGWKAGPTVLAGGTGYDRNGWLPAKTHTWGSSIMEFGGAEVAGGKKAFPFDYGTAVGYEVNIQLRPGEKLVRRWSNQGHHVNESDGGGYPVNDRELGYAAAWGDLNPSTRIGNGTLEYRLPLADGRFKSGMLTVENLSSRSEAPGAAVHVSGGASRGTLIFRMPSSYVYLGGQLTFTPLIAPGGIITVSISDNNGLDWKKIAEASISGTQVIDLKRFVYRRYDYRLKFELEGAGTGLDAVSVVNDIQNSTRALPALDAGENTIAFAVGKQEGTITVNGKTDGEAGNVTLKDFHPEFEGASITIPLVAPGEITRIRASASYRCSTEQQAFLVQASFDQGKTFTDIGRFDGVGRGNSRYLVFDKVPDSATAVQVRLAAQGGKPTLWDFRIDADYREPHGGFLPVRVTYVYTEAGREKTDVHVARDSAESYSIRCSAKPEMKSITLEVAE